MQILMSVVLTINRLVGIVGIVDTLIDEMRLGF